MNREDIVYADKKYRNKIIIAYLLIAAVLAVSLYHTTEYFDHLLRDVSSEDKNIPIEKMTSMVLFMREVTAAVSVLTGIYLVSIGLKTLRDGQFPPAGMKVLKDTKIKRGSHARYTAYGLFLSAAILMTLPNIALKALHDVIERMQTLHSEDIVSGNAAGAYNGTVNMNADRQ